jgi:hypothetical protein
VKKAKVMSMELMDHINGESANDSKETLFLLGGVAMVVFGAGLILSTPAIRRYLSGVGIGNLLQAAVPDVERYMKLRAM